MTRPELEIVDGADVVCVCGQRVVIGMAADGTTAMAVHSPPACKDFLERDILAFATWLRQRLTGAPTGAPS